MNTTSLSNAAVPLAVGEMRLLGADLIYARLPKINCKGLCQECCGPIAMSECEWERIKAKLGYEPKGTPDLTCPMLDRKTGRCTVYAIRPLICRLWGLVEEMRCPFGCTPERWVSKSESYELLAAMDALDTHNVEVCGARKKGIR